MKIYNWFQKHDKFGHFLLAWLLCYFDIYFAVGFMLAIEATQIDIFGIKGRWKDTMFDVVFDVLGFGLFLLIDRLLYVVILCKYLGIF